MTEREHPTGPWTPEEIERERRARAAMVRANAQRGIEANFKDAAAGARFAERFAASFTPRDDGTGRPRDLDDLEHLGFLDGD